MGSPTRNCADEERSIIHSPRFLYDNFTDDSSPPRKGELNSSVLDMILDTTLEEQGDTIN